MKNPAFLLILALFMFSCNNSDKEPAEQGNKSGASPETISLKLGPAEFKEAMTKPGMQLVDVRTQEEMTDGYIMGATHLDFYSDNFETDLIENLDKDKPVLVYCRSGGRSGNTAQMLEKAGFSEIYDLKGGFTAWSGSQ
ncbi:MAG: rhodanese-like domain-containing protein [Bacteroidota bacterium]